MYIHAVRLEMSPDAPRDITFLDNYINDELISRLDIANANNANYAKLSKQMVNVIKKLHKSGRKPARKTSKTKKKKLKNKSKKKKSKKSEDSSSSSESSSSESESEAEAEINVNISQTKKKFHSKKEPTTDVVTVKCKIKHLVILTGTVDPGIATTPTESLGIVRNIPVNFAFRCTIYADFAIVKYPKPMLILPNTLLDKYNYDLLASKQELRLECNGKEFFIPINMHKDSQGSQNLSEDNDALKKMSYEELKKKLYSTLKSKEDLNELYINNKGDDSFRGSRQRLGGIYEQELKKKLYSALRSKAEINDLIKKLLAKYSDQRELEAKYSAKIKSLKSDIKTLKRELTLAHKASSTNKVQILSLEAKIHELKGKLEDIDLERTYHDLNVMGRVIEEPAQINLQSNSKEIDSLRLKLEQANENLSSKKYTIECMEKGIESSNSIFKWKIDIWFSERLKLMEKNRSLKDQLALKKKLRGTSHDEVDP
ncbi:hypothetical protein C1645_876558 [Glomus cerebriforme]|uniref:Uncharacterized protein n=1 Tax=Glomus cerebriforme TaxID=658196 RepID=A0A397T0X2_9GLOM|nr:hypothetical protein C1645_876558 [Glomus cerebriforme]